jgi:hypothetical protein
MLLPGQPPSSTGSKPYRKRDTVLIQDRWSLLTERAACTSALQLQQPSAQK